MLIEVYDDDAPAVVWLFCGRTNVDDDHRRWLSSMHRLDKVAVARGCAAALLVIDADNPPPPRQARASIRALVTAIEGKCPLAVVTSSSVARTIIAGLQMAKIVGFALKGFGDVDAAIQWLAAQPEAPTTASATLRNLVAEARAKERFRASQAGAPPGDATA